MLRSGAGWIDVIRDGRVGFLCDCRVDLLYLVVESTYRQERKMNTNGVLKINHDEEMLRDSLRFENRSIVWRANASRHFL